MNKTLANFTQTYSVDRLEVAQYLEQDRGFNKMLSLLDRVYLSFHNVEDLSYCKKFATCIKNSHPRAEFLSFLHPHYSQTYPNFLKMLNKEKISDCFFIQDDAICVIRDKNLDVLDDIINFYKSNLDIQMLNLDNRQNPKYLIDQGCKYIQKRLVSKKYNLWAYEFETSEWLKTNNTIWGMDDSPYLANVDLLLRIYDDPNYFLYSNMDQAEIYIKNKCEKNFVFSRWILDKSVFRYFSYTGMHVYKTETRDKELKLLKRLFKFKNL